MSKYFETLRFGAPLTKSILPESTRIPTTEFNMLSVVPMNLQNLLHIEDPVECRVYNLDNRARLAADDSNSIQRQQLDSCNT